MPHVDEGMLHALLDGALRADDPASAAEVERHLAGCPDCRARLEAADDLRGRASGVLAAAAPAEPVTAPDFDEVRARASRSGRRRHAPAALRRQVRWTRNVAWAASLVIALGTGYLLRDLADPPGAASRDGEVQSEMGGPEPETTRGSQAAGAPATESPEASASEASASEASASEASPGSEASEEFVREAPAPEPPQSAVADAEEDADLEAETMAQPPVGSASRLRAAGVETAAAEAAAADVSRSMSPGSAGSPSSVAGPAAEEEQWSVATLAEARQAMEGPVYRLPRAEILEVYVGSAATRPAVMTRQRLESGIPIQVVQRWGESAAPPAAEKAEADGAGLPRPERATTTRGDYVLEVTGSLPAALLEILAESATPAP